MLSCSCLTMQFQAKRQLRKEFNWSNAGEMLRRKSWDNRWRGQGVWVEQSEVGGLARSRNPGRNQMFESSTASGWVREDMSTAESWEAEWMPLPTQSPQYVDFLFCQTQLEEMVMMVSLEPNFPGQQPLLAPDGHVVYPVDSFPARLGTPESCTYLGSVDLPLGEVGGGADENEEKQGWSKVKGNLNNRTLEAGRRPRGQETWKKERRAVDGKEEEIPRREPSTFGKWMAASKRDKKVLKKKRSGKSLIKSTDDVKKPPSLKSCEVQMATEAMEKSDVQIERKQGNEKVENQCGENEDIELLADSLRPLKLDWNELE